MKAVILAGGRGTRLAPYTTTFPKPLVPIGEYPIIEILIRQMIAQGIDDITLNVGYLAELIRAYFLQRPDLTSRFKLNYVSEVEPTGTAGSLTLVEGLDETFLVLNGDLLTTLRFTDLVGFHKQSDAALTIAMHEKRINIDLGVLVTGEGSAIVDYREKPVVDYMVSMGVYVYEPRVLSYLEPGAYRDFPDLVLSLIAAGEKVVGYHSKDKWLDIGRPEDYALAVEEFTNSTSDFFPWTR